MAWYYTLKKFFQPGTVQKKTGSARVCRKKARDQPARLESREWKLSRVRSACNWQTFKSLIPSSIYKAFYKIYFLGHSVCRHYQSPVLKVITFFQCILISKAAPLFFRMQVRINLNTTILQFRNNKTNVVKLFWSSVFWCIQIYIHKKTNSICISVFLVKKFLKYLRIDLCKWSC